VAAILFDENPILVSAGLHHRFTQVHPSISGWERCVATVITTMVLLKAGLLPLVVDRGMRADYIGALESADHGHSERLQAFFCSARKNAILQVLSLDVEAERRSDSLLPPVIESLEVK
jgi:hypothetical protein